MAKRNFSRPASAGADIMDLKNGSLLPKASVPVVCSQIRRFREQMGIEQKELARKAGVSANAVSNWENGRSRPDIHLLPEICQALHVTLYDLFALDNPALAYSGREQRLIDSFRKLSDGHRLAAEGLMETLLRVQEAENCPRLRRLPLIEKPLAAGLGDPTEFAEDSEPVFVYDSPVAARADYLFKVNGDSMLPSFRDGDRVYVEKTGGRGLQFGDVGAFMIGNEMYIKEYEADGLHSANPAYPVMRFSDEESVYLIGRVLAVMDEAELAGRQDIERYTLLHPDQ